MSVYTRNVIVVIKIGAYIHGCFFSVGAYYLAWFYGTVTIIHVPWVRRNHTCESTVLSDPPLKSNIYVC